MRFLLYCLYYGNVTSALQDLVALNRRVEQLRIERLRIVRFESCDYKVALSIDRMRFGWRCRIDFQQFYFTAIRLMFLLLAAEFMATPGPRFWELRNSRFCAAKLQDSLLLNTSEICGLAVLTPACSAATMGGCRPMHLTSLNNLELLATDLDVRKALNGIGVPHFSSKLRLLALVPGEYEKIKENERRPKKSKEKTWKK